MAEVSRVERAPDDLFLRIVAGDVPATIVHSDDQVVAFEDIAPQAPTHVLVVPRERYENVAELAAKAPQVLARLVEVAQRIADERCGGEYRLVFNTGTAVGQSVFHVHGHVLGGRDFTWPPG
ncbi:histidine triad nucleotide-binding protein [Kineococcus aurantiacus]|uniref:Histidine triad (HIT) family protein n=1 Tax=Kineococcus aurantiacus TaxID=37633 RepID=A0A7Y9ASX8_9ACTN|nr:histidine triad nucleotide-binding protein [Kineococcus aurantiacus]NYD21232.1 histidine triad (HIT) family protein [Kineococcus aurantiacus]